MKLIERTFELSAPEGLGKKPRPELIGPVLTSLRERVESGKSQGGSGDRVPRGSMSSLRSNNKPCREKSVGLSKLPAFHAEPKHALGSSCCTTVPSLIQHYTGLGLRQLARRLNPVMTAAQCAAAGYLLGATTSCAVICGSDNDAY